MTKEFYCPTCKNTIVVKFVDTYFETCECDKCEGIMFIKEVNNEKTKKV